ncbi:hypothetical protein QD460_25985 [Rhizobium jaguaris]|uniref:hypothetical protein n=1 Tax=Rhizobium jaguaris TaxID=1312183 RepID=UPI0039BF0AAB
MRDLVSNIKQAVTDAGQGVDDLKALTIATEQLPAKGTSEQITEHTLSESAVRRRAKAAGYVVRKSRTRHPHSDNRGLYVLYNARGNVTLGIYFDASLKEIQNFLNG